MEIVFYRLVGKPSIVGRIRETSSQVKGEQRKIFWGTCGFISPHITLKNRLLTSSG